MALFAAAYVSTPTRPFTDRELSELLLASRHWNAVHGVTGQLVVAERDGPDGTPLVARFVQWIEGDADVVRGCLRRIHADPRHHQLAIQYFGPVPHRRFPDWDMALRSVPASHLDAVCAEMVPEPAPVAAEALGLDRPTENGG